MTKLDIIIMEYIFNEQVATIQDFDLCVRIATKHKIIAESLEIIKIKKIITYPLKPIVLLIDCQHSSDLQQIQT